MIFTKTRLWRFLEWEKFLPSIVKLVKKWKGPVIFTRFILKERRGVHQPNLFLPGSQDAQIINKLLPLTKRKNAKVSDKHGYSAFAGTNLECLLKKKKIKTVYLAGVKTEYCVLATAFSAFDCGFKVKVIEDCITERDKKFHDIIFLKVKLLFGKDSVVQSKKMV